ncbi:MAG: DinB family protein [Thermomicrobiales bacterium]
MALDNYRDLIDELVGFPVELRAAVESAGQAPEGEWSAEEIVAHLTAGDEFWLARLNLLLTQREPFLPEFGTAADDRMAELLEQTVEENLDHFSDVRGQIVSMLMSMTLGDWDRTGTHETQGERSIVDTVEAIADHDADHLAQLKSYS